MHGFMPNLSKKIAMVCTDTLLCEKHFKIALYQSSETFYVSVFQKLILLIFLTKKTVCWHLQSLSTAMSKYLSWLRVRLIKKRLGIPQLYEPHHKIIKAINIQGSLSSRMHALICYSPFFHHVHFDKSFFFLPVTNQK